MRGYYISLCFIALWLYACAPGTEINTSADSTNQVTKDSNDVSDNPGDTNLVDPSVYETQAQVKNHFRIFKLVPAYSKGRDYEILNLDAYSLNATSLKMVVKTPTNFSLALGETTPVELVTNSTEKLNSNDAFSKSTEWGNKNLHTVSANPSVSQLKVGSDQNYLLLIFKVKTPQSSNPFRRVLVYRPVVPRFTTQEMRNCETNKSCAGHKEVTVQLQEVIDGKLAYIQGKI